MIQVFKACPPFCHAEPLEEMSNSLGTLQLIQNSPSGLLLGLFIQQTKVLKEKKTQVLYVKQPYNLKSSKAFSI